jgi:hypothetical protein
MAHAFADWKILGTTGGIHRTWLEKNSRRKARERLKKCSEPVLKRQQSSEEAVKKLQLPELGTPLLLKKKGNDAA